MKCLRCKTVEMEIQVVGEASDIVEVDVCPSCGGSWLDPSEMKKLDDNFFVDMEDIEYEAVAPTADDAALSCPRCADAPTLTKCHPQGHPDLVLDNCSKCKGFWLDKGEMQKVHDVSDQLIIASLLSLDESE
jgi:uncharacterized protein